MSVFSTLHFNWLPQPSLYAEAQNWTARQQASRILAEDLAFASDTFASAATDQTSGMINLAARAALTRTQSAAQAKVNSVLASDSNSPISSISANSSSLTLADGTVINNDPNTYLSSGSKLNLNAGTLTLSNGTVIDTKTGLKKIDLTV